jgi:glyoxylase-like metal-dependent hydrolase (beta-lactamase superfamily II)
MELEPGIVCLTIGHEPFKGFPPPNSYLLVGSERALAVDTGWDVPEDHAARMAALAEWARVPLAAVLITHRHPDHGGGALALARETGAPLWAHARERETIERDRFKGAGTIDAEVAEGDRIDLGGLTARVVEAPGHTDGCLAVWVEERRALLTTDTVMGVSTTVIKPEDGSLADYARTLERFATLEARVFYTGHGAPVTDPAGRLRALSEHRRKREAELVRALAAGPQTVPELRERIYAGLPSTRVRLAEAQLTTGLRKLMDEGTARAADAERFALA